MSAPPRFTWDRPSARYRNRRDGRYVSPQAIRGALDDAIITNAAKDVRALTQQLRAGEILLSEWETAMRVQIKASQLSAASLARGGFDQMTQADFGRVGRAVRDQYAYLARMSAQIADGTQRMDGTVLRRAEMYVAAAREAYERQQLVEDKARGLTEERSVRGASDSCDECVELEARGWVESGTTPLPGQRICRTNCACLIERRVAA